MGGYGAKKHLHRAKTFIGHAKPLISSSKIIKFIRESCDGVKSLRNGFLSDSRTERSWSRRQVPAVLLDQFFSAGGVINRSVSALAAATVYRCCTIYPRLKICFGVKNGPGGRWGMKYSRKLTFKSETVLRADKSRNSIEASTGAAPEINWYR